MTLRDFFDKISNHRFLKGVDCAHDPIAIQRCDGVVLVPVEMVEGNAWRDVEAGIMGINLLYHVSRIVGYNSRIENWNKSKLGELADRRMGNYAV